MGGPGLMTDPLLSLSMAVHSNKGVYALLLGAGVSRSSGVPTGGEVAEDLIRQIALLKKTDCIPNPMDWYRNTFGSEPSYSEILPLVAPTSAERLHLLRAYFEPKEDEFEKGDRKPTVAHLRIAELVTKGYIRVIITTNFDRLMEQALAQIGMGATVISSADAAAGAVPLAHARCTIIKVNGDYLDTRLKNTVGELNAYDPKITRLLGQVFDEYGLIVCGWSGTSDTALRSAMEGSINRRFTAWWAQYGSAQSPEAQSLITLRGAAVIPIESADSFFDALSQNLIALERRSESDPVSGDVAVARLKRYLSSDEHGIALHDLLSRESLRVREYILSDRFPLGGTTITEPAEVADRLGDYESVLSVLIRLTSVAAYWAKPEQFGEVLTCLKDLSAPRLNVGGINWRIPLQWYPPTLLFYAMGISALANSNYTLLKEILYMSVKRDPNAGSEKAVLVLDDHRVLNRSNQIMLPGRERQRTPLLNHMFEVLRSGLSDLILSPARYEELFDEFEYICSMAAWDSKYTRSEVNDLIAQRKLLPRPPRVPGRFAWKDSFRDPGGVCERFAITPVLPKHVVGLMRAGMFETAGGLSTDKYLLAKDAVDTYALA